MGISRRRNKVVVDEFGSVRRFSFHSCFPLGRRLPLEIVQK